MALSFNINILTGYIFTARPNYDLRVSDRQEKHAFAQECFYLQDVFSYINERDASSDVCKYKQMLLKMELHLTNLALCTVCYIWNSMVLTTVLMF